MKLTILTDNCGGDTFFAEHGLSYLIEHDGERILFDTGHSDVFIKNAQKLGININNDIETVVLSHGHWDHANGLKYLSGKKLITHTQSFMKRYLKNDKRRMLGIELSKEAISKKFDLVTTEQPYKITNNIIFLGSIPRENDFESKTTMFVDKSGEPDFVPDDSALALIQNRELIIITGCSHSGICNIISYAQKVTGILDIKAVIGGFHLKQNNEQTKETVKFLKQLEVEYLYPSHCTELEALVSFSIEFGIKQLKTGRQIVIL